MPTGYTCYIKEGISFPKFALKCARAFGALISMRDSSMEEEVPDEIKPSEFHRIEMENSQRDLDKANNITLEEAKERATSEFEDLVMRYRKELIENDELKKKYEDMLTKVRAWEPPTPEHNGLKTFMIEQIESSINFDCSYVMKEPVEKSAETWLDEYKSKCKWDLEYHTKEWNEEVKRSSGRTIWIRELKRSLIELKEE